MLSFIVIFVIYVVSGATISKVNNRIRCTLLEHPRNGRWSFPDNTNLSFGDEVQSGVTLKVTCSNQHMLNGSSFTTCENGRWNPKIGQCLELCPPIIEKSSTKVTCTTQGKTSDCLAPTDGTIATIQCAPFYENADYNRNPFRKCEKGKWNEEILSCTPVCGVQQENVKNNTTKHFYPWNVIIYERKKIDKRVFLSVKCVGTLINEKIVITAAGCVSNEIDGTVDSSGKYKLAAGKVYIDPHDPRETNPQFSEVKDIFVPDDYKGKLLKYIGDIAVVIASDSFNMTKQIQPACLDWTEKYKAEFEVSKSSPSIAGALLGGATTINQIFEIPLLDQICKNSCQPPPARYQLVADTVDKYISEYETFDPSEYKIYDNLLFNTSRDPDPSCSMNVGVGLVSKNPYNAKYYLIGVLRHYSLAQHEKNCFLEFLTFTKVYQYISDFIAEKTLLYTPINSGHLQTSCGIKSVQAKTLIVGGVDVVKSDYPWQVALYKTTNFTKTLICGGSLINQRIILTAAHCVANDEGNKFSAEDYIIAVGKYYRDFDDRRDDHAQFSTLKEIIVPHQYQGQSQNYVGDIALLISENSFILTKEVQPICVDWESKYESQFLQPNVTGFVAGWGFTQENLSPSEKLQELEVPYIDTEACKNNFPKDFEIFLTADKLCSGFLQNGKSVCKGDSGGGLVFKNRNDDRYYLGGIVSLSPQAPTGGCNSQHYSLYTRVSVYMENFILNQARLYWN